MSMIAKFVQVEPAELAKIQADPTLTEGLFHEGPMIPPPFLEASKKLEERMRTAGPQMFAAALQNLDPRIRQRLEERLGATAQSFAGGQGGETLLKMMQERRARAVEATKMSQEKHATLSLDKEWHGVHYMLCGKVEPDDSLLSKAVLGGTILGEDDEGFSGYGPARCFTPQEVADLSRALSNPEVEDQASVRFDASEMTRLEIYPGWRATDREQVIDALRRLRDFYAEAASKGRGIVTCLV